VGKVRSRLLRLADVTSGYSGKPVIMDVSFTVFEGEKVVVIGPNGSGKSTLLKTILMLIEPIKGSIIFRDVDIVKLPKSELPRIRVRMGYVPQEGVLFPHMKVVDNVALPLRLALKMSKAEARKKALDYLKLFDIHDLAYRYPAQLSGGQRQKVAIIRALALEPELLLLDEPTLNLDPSSRRDVLEVLYNVAKLGKSMIVVTHEMDVVNKISDKVIAMKSGRVVYEGSFNESIVKEIYET
jgi:polar amino acid transport system ATP-binding protein